MENSTGYIVLGPKETIRYSACVQIFYSPTESQIRNMKEMLGWDYATPKEAEELLEKR